MAEQNSRRSFKPNQLLRRIKCLLMELDILLTETEMALLEDLKGDGEDWSRSLPHDLDKLF